MESYPDIDKELMEILNESSLAITDDFIPLDSSDIFFSSEYSTEQTLANDADDFSQLDLNSISMCDLDVSPTKCHDVSPLNRTDASPLQSENVSALTFLNVSPPLKCPDVASSQRADTSSLYVFPEHTEDNASRGSSTDSSQNSPPYVPDVSNPSSLYVSPEHTEDIASRGSSADSSQNSPPYVPDVSNPSFLYVSPEHTEDIAARGSSTGSSQNSPPHVPDVSNPSFLYVSPEHTEDIISRDGSTVSSQNSPLYIQDDSNQSSPESVTPSSTPLLPPCRVCGEKASGFHYGANTCEPCKGFFRRCIVKNEHSKKAYRCSGDGNCVISPGRRSVCSSCRYKKCLSVGMSQHAIKTGRYTYEKRTRDTKEVKKLQAIAKPAELTYHTKITEDEIKAVISRLVDVQRKFHPNFSRVFDKELSLQKQKLVYKEYTEKIQMFGHLPIVSNELYDEIYNETGIDLDDRKKLMNKIAQKMDKGLKNMIEFMKSLPEFSGIPINDQTKLIKGSNSEYWFLVTHKLMNPELNVFTDVCANETVGLHKDELLSVFKNTDFYEEAFSLCRTFQNLDLTEEEVAVVRGIAITFADRCDLEQPEKVEQIQLKLMDCLHWLSKSYKQNPEQRLCKILDRLTALRTLTEMNKVTNKEKSEWPIMQSYPLVLEVING